MASSASTFQYKTNISVPREDLLRRVVRCEDLNKKDLRVFLHLLTHLDAKTFKDISKKQIADDLNISKSSVSTAIENLIDYEIIEAGSSTSVNKGYRLLF